MTENKKTLTIDDLLAALQNPEKNSDLVNDYETWRRIGNKDSFSELDMNSSELDEFLKEWISENPYDAIS